ncbi:hypothetical protein [Streptomyces sp. DH37]|uniref:hypothetical protein n=1 Tax=Streptomyces sp. DH37 TaxID=3040122 RepID=UPI00244317DB|nr:hypothetical protein [Streptomyces sp. DH37]MDG9701654.1 hypothetical protein [Streptomyces sp. DH37]
MATIGYADLPVPDGGDAPAGSGQLAALAAAIDPRLLHHVTNEAERDTEFAGAPVSTAVVADNGTLWIKTGVSPDVWTTVWEPYESWQNVTPAAGMTVSSPPAQYRRVGNQVYLRGRIAKTDESNIVGTSGAAICAVPTNLAPVTQATYPCPTSLAGDIASGVGKVEIVGADNPSSTWGPPGTLVWWNQESTAGTPWVNISGYYWLD